MRGGPLHSKRIGYRFRSVAVPLINVDERVKLFDRWEIRRENLRAGIAAAAELECTCGFERTHRTAAPGCRLRNLPR